MDWLELSAGIHTRSVLDDQSMTLTYSVASGPVPFKDYSATMIVQSDNEDSCSLS